MSTEGPIAISQSTLRWIPNLQRCFSPDTYDLSRQIRSHYESQPPVFTNGSGFTVSQGYGVYGEQIGYGHGVIDAHMAVEFAEKWHDLGQQTGVQTERTFTTGPVGPGLGFTFGINPAGQMGNDFGGASQLVIPGGFSTDAGFVGYWEEYYADPPAPFDPANPDSWPVNTRGFSYIDFAVPPAQGIDIETVEVKVSISGSNDDLDFLRIFLTSPDGTQSELNNFYVDTDFAPDYQTQPVANPVRATDPAGGIDLDGGDFTWTFSTNRHWGESSNSGVIIDPVSGEPVLAEVFDPNNFLNTYDRPIFRNWELHIENYSNSTFGLDGVEIVWHGKPIAGGELDTNYAPSGIAKAQRVQGFVGIDSDNNEAFNFNRYIQTVDDPDLDPDTIRVSDVNRRLDFTDVNGDGLYDPATDTITQEPFAANVLVEAFIVHNPGQANEFVEANATARFLTGADGNYYFDLDPDLTYEIRATDLNSVPGVFQDHVFEPGAIPIAVTAAGFTYQPHYLAEWRITPDWFYAPDRDNSNRPSLDNPGEILFGQFDGNADGTNTLAPRPFDNTDPLFPVPGDAVPIVPMAVKNINFLIKRDAAPDEVIVQGTVFIDIDGNNAISPQDTPAPDVRVFYDINGDGVFSQGAEPYVITASDGFYSFTIPATSAGTFTVAVDPTYGPTAWVPSVPGGLVQSVIAEPGDPASVVNFFLLPPTDPSGGPDGNILGFVYVDLDEDGVKDNAELGVEGVRVFADTDQDGVWDNDNDGVPEAGEEVGVLTNPNGSFFLNNVPAGAISSPSSRREPCINPSRRRAAFSKSASSMARPGRASCLACGISPTAIGAICLRTFRPPAPMAARATSFSPTSAWARTSAATSTASRRLAPTSIRPMTVSWSSAASSSRALTRCRSRWPAWAGG